MEKIQRQMLKQLQEQMDVAQKIVERMQEFTPNVLNISDPAEWKKLQKSYDSAIKEGSKAIYNMAVPDLPSLSAMGDAMLAQQCQFMEQRKQLVQKSMEQMLEHQKQYIAAMGLSPTVPEPADIVAPAAE